MEKHRHWIDRHPADTLQTLAATLRAAPAGSHWHALLDPGFCTPREWSRTGVAQDAESLYARYGNADLEELSPVLLPLTLDEEGISRLQRLLALAEGRPMLSLLCGQAATAALAQHLRGQLEAQTEDGRVYLVRLADTRCLPTWWQVLEPAQQARFCQGIDQWWYPDRTAQWQTLALPPAPVQAEADVAAYALDAAQHAALKQAALPDTVIAYLAGRASQFGRLSDSPSRVHACVAAAIAGKDDAQGNVSAEGYREMLSALRAEDLLSPPLTGEAGDAT